MTVEPFNTVSNGPKKCGCNNEVTLLTKVFVKRKCAWSDSTVLENLVVWCQKVCPFDITTFKMFLLISPGVLGEAEVDTVLIALLKQKDEGLWNALCDRGWKAIVSPW